MSELGRVFTWRKTKALILMLAVATRSLVTSAFERDGWLVGLTILGMSTAFIWGYGSFEDVVVVLLTCLVFRNQSNKIVLADDL